MKKLHGSEEERRYQLEKMLDHLGHTMEMDDALTSESFEFNKRVLLPHRNDIIDYIINHKKKA